VDQLLNPAVRVARVLVGRVVMLIAALFVVVWGISLLPGNGVRALLGRDASAAAVTAREHELGLDQPIPMRFWDWLTELLRGNFGTTLRGEPIGAVLAAKLPNTLVLTGGALLITVVTSTALALWWTSNPRRQVRRAVSVGTIVIAALPEFVVAALTVLIFALTLDVLPAVTVQNAAGAPRDSTMYVLPVIALALPQIGWNTRVFAANIREARALPFVRAATVEGIRESTLFFRYIAPRTLPTMVASLATTVGMIVGGSVVVESVFNFPGVGAVVAGSVAARDVNMVAAVVACTGVVILALLLLADAARAWSRARAT
jgi:peptide/nickel transport system permease protein